MVAISMYRGNLHIGGHDSGAPAPRRWEAPRRSLGAKRFRRLVRNRSRAVARLAGTPPRQVSTTSSDMNGGRRAADPEREAPDEEEADDGGEEEQGQLQQDQDQEHQEEQGNGEAEQQQQQQEQQEEEEEEQEEGAVEDAVMEDAGEVVVEGDGNGDAEEGQGESEGVDPNQEEVSYPDGIDEKKRKLNEKLDILNKKKHGLVQMLKQVLNAEEEIRRRSMQASLRAAMPQPSENATDGSSVSRLAPRMTVDVNFGDVAGDSDAGSNQGTPGRPLHHFHSISPSTASFARSPFGSLQGHTPRSPATFSTASPSRFATNIHQGQPPALYSASLPGSNYVASSPSPAASGGSSSVFRDPRPPNST
ncbi:acidic leucine-rich nuclear phosphoprotein 32-related protein 1-like [Miscanthus floridulus]|uniref:acidic leucine-rich nuclear phosphoprotein 32-related protein 1-like n=1 Tax=Miscanthus floridulus TaxID=154761 RepID=UPI003458974B